MKKYSLAFVLTLLGVNLQAQEVADGLRFAQDKTNGTARFRAMSGAFGALGGDLSSVNVNPAGSVIFANNHVGLSLNYYGLKNNSSYFGKNTSDNSNTVDLNQAGGVFVFENNNEKSNWKKFSLALNYENANNFDNKVFSAGVNPNKSGVSFFTNNANGVPLYILEDYFYDELDYVEQQASLAYQSYLISPFDGTNLDNTSYFANTQATGDFYQENEVSSVGSNGKLSFNFGAQYLERFSFGLNLNSHFSDYRKKTSFYEDYFDAMNQNPNQGIQAFRFNNDLYVSSRGFSLQLGTIAKVNQNIRLGLAYESSTWSTVNEELTQSLSTDCADCPNPTYDENPGITNIYEPYSLKTPDKWTGSFAYIFGKKGLISVDLSTKNYNNIIFKPTKDFSGLNNRIKNELVRANEFKIGAEHKIKNWSLRGGYRFEESPYADKKLMSDLIGYSAGLGYNFGGTKLDFAYSTATRNYSEQFLSTGMTDKATIDSKNNNITVTLSFEL